MLFVISSLWDQVGVRHLWLKSNYFGAHGTHELLPVAGGTSRAGHVLFGPRSLAGIDDHSSLQAHGSHRLSPDEDLALSPSFSKEKSNGFTHSFGFQGCKGGLPFLLCWGCSHQTSGYHEQPTLLLLPYVRLQASSRHRLQTPLTISVPSWLHISHKHEPR